MDHKDVEERVRAHQWPDVSPDLRQRVMSVAVATAEHLTWSDRVWFSRGWRVAAAVAMVAVIALDQLTGATPQPVAPTPQVMAEAQAIEDVAMEVGLPAQAAAWLARRSLFDASRPKPRPLPGAAMLETLALDTTGGM